VAAEDCQQVINHNVQVVVDIAIPDAMDAVSELLQRGRADRIGGAFFVGAVRSAVDFYNQHLIGSW